VRVGIAGASGYAGGELLRLCASHPDLDVAVVTAGSAAGGPVAAVTPALAGAYPDLVMAPMGAGVFDGLDLVFLALPHGASQDLVPELDGSVGAVVDLAADFRLRDPSLYPVWYGEAHRSPHYLERFVYGLPELDRGPLRGTRLVAAPGCYPTAAVLALAPFVRAGVLDGSSVIVDAASGVSGAGRAPKANLHFGAVDGSMVAYGLLDHRHTPEMEQGLSLPVLFTPHLAPMSRGILATCYARPIPEARLDSGAALAILRAAYHQEPFVVVRDDPPATKDTAGSNCAHVTARVDPRTGWLVTIAALDNLGKGAAGQAIQCANLVLGLPEQAGLPTTGVYP
jgi:N-acetyl-gamma-glutamyl-phosphate reductase